ncbi:hypothetical protein [Mycobacterium sp. 155]|uniref:hypothetical protein n=1 Tax=Mycobacterium sp. 155 TaxID=1157943 RepID=UPI00035FF9AD|nr:hypothetical protein [Mycobacterium sp. 155]
MNNLYSRHWEKDGAHSSNARINVDRADERLGVPSGTVDALRRQGLIWDLWGTDASTIPLRSIREFEARSWGDLPGLILDTNRLWDRDLGRVLLQVLDTSSTRGFKEIENYLRETGGVEHANSIARVRAYQEMRDGAVPIDLRGLPPSYTNLVGGFKGTKIPVQQVVDWIDANWGPIVIQTLVKTIEESDNADFLVTT